MNVGVNLLWKELMNERSFTDVNYLTGEEVYGYIDENYLYEIWAPVYKFPHYLVSTEGRVWSIRRQIFLKLVKRNSQGYLCVMLCDHNRVKTISVHRLVAETFLPNDLHFPAVCHIDHDPLNNTLDNLEWAEVCKHRENNF
jgi:hypothetical protein